MLWREIVTLINGSESPNSNGFNAFNEVSRKDVFANKKAVRQSEFYLASAQGVNVLGSFEVKTIDYSGEQFLEYNGKRSYILRVYSDDNNENSELILSDRTLHGNSAGGVMSGK